VHGANGLLAYGFHFVPQKFQHLQNNTSRPADIKSFFAGGKGSCLILTSPITAGIMSSVTILFTAESAAVISNTLVLQQTKTLSQL
jgi:hypothetical protein